MVRCERSEPRTMRPQTRRWPSPSPLRGGVRGGGGPRLWLGADARSRPVFPAKMDSRLRGNDAESAARSSAPQPLMVRCERSEPRTMRPQPQPRPLPPPCGEGSGVGVPDAPAQGKIRCGALSPWPIWIPDLAGMTPRMWSVSGPQLLPQPSSFPGLTRGSSRPRRPRKRHGVLDGRVKPGHDEAVG